MTDETPQQYGHAQQRASSGWRGINVDAGLLTALVSGVVFAFVAVTGVQYWVSDRVAHYVDPYRDRVIDLQGRVDQHRESLEDMHIRLRLLEHQTEDYSDGDESAD